MQTFLIVMIVVALISGATDTISFEIQNKQKVIEYGIQKNFCHPYMQLAMRYVSNSLIFIVYAIQLYQNGALFGNQIISEENKNQDKKIQSRCKWQYLYIIIPTILDILANLGYYIALNFLSASVYQMLRGGVLITTYIFSYIFLNTKFKKIKSAGCLFMLTGLVIVGTVNLYYSSGSNSQQQYTMIGYGLILLSITINAFHYISEEHLVKHYHFDPLVIIGFQGIYGIIFACIYIPVLSVVPCIFKQESCVINDSGSNIFQNFNIWARQVHNNGVILFAVILVLFSMATFNATGITITKALGSLTRSIIDVSRTIIVWIVGIIITVTLGSKNDSFKFQSTIILQIIGQVIGFIILLFGNMIYYQMQIVKFNCFKQQQSQNQNVLLQRQS